MCPERKIVEEIEDGTVFLRKITKDDYKFFFRALNNKETIKYMSIGPLLSLRHSKNLMERYLDYWDNHQQYNYVIEIVIEGVKESIGAVSLWNLNWLHKRGEIGIWIKPKHWKRGFAKKSIQLIRIIGFSHLNLHRLEAYITIKNQSSIGLFKSCGFQEECVMEDYLYLRGIHHNAIVLACINDLE